MPQLTSRFYQRHESLRKLVRHLLPTDSDRLLDVGCQKGDITRALPRPRTQLVALDIRPWPEWNAPDDNPQAAPQFVQASATAIPVARPTFDAVVSSECIQYLDRLEDALDEIDRVLQPGGTLVLSMPESHVLHRWLDPYWFAYLAKRILVPWKERGRPALCRGRLRQIRQHLENGWALEECYRRGSFLFLWLSWTIDRFQTLRLRLHRLGGLGRALATVTTLPALYLLMAGMRIDFAISWGPLSYNNVVRYRKLPSGDGEE